MSSTSPSAARPLPSKARIIAGSLADLAIDLLLPTVAFLLLTPTGLPPVICLTIGGYLVAAKACAGHVVSADGAATPHGPRAFVVGAAIAAVSTAVTVGARSAGGSDLLSLTLGAAVFLVVEAVNLARQRRRIDGFALLVLVELIATLILTAVSDDARFVLIRPSFYTAIAGLFALATVWSEKPFMMQVTKPMAAGGDPVRAAAFDLAGRQSPAFRRAEQAMTFGLGLVLLAEAVLRVVAVLSQPAGNILAASLWSQVPGVALFVAYIAFVRLVFVPRASREVDALMPAASAMMESGSVQAERRS